MAPFIITLCCVVPTETAHASFIILRKYWKSNMKLVFMEICSSTEFQSQGGHAVKGSLLPDKPGYLWFHSTPQVLYNEFPPSVFSLPMLIYIRFPYWFLHLKHLEMLLIESSEEVPFPITSGEWLHPCYTLEGHTKQRYFHSWNQLQLLAKGRFNQASHLPSLCLGIFHILEWPHLIAKSHQPGTTCLQEGQSAT